MISRCINKVKIINIVVSFFFAIALVWGYQCDHYREVLVGNPWTYVAMLLIWVVASVASGLLFGWLQGRESSQATPDGLNIRRIWPISTAVIWVCYFIVFLGVYPGFFVYDAQYELNETVCRAFSDHQPIFHVLYMGGIIQAVHKLTDDYNIAIAVFILVQMTFIAVVMGYIVRELNRDRLGRRGAIALTIYLGVFPVLVMYALCSAKDGVFCAFLMLTFLYIRKIMGDPTGFLKKPAEIVMFILSAAGMMLMRSNGVHAFVVFLIVFDIVMLTMVKKNCRSGTNSVMSTECNSTANVMSTIHDSNEEVMSTSKATEFGTYTLVFKTVALCIGAVLLYVILNKGMLAAVHASDYGSRELLTVPIQQMARIYNYDRDVMTDEEVEKLLEYLPDTALSHYNPKCSDLVKVDFNEEAFAADKMGFIKLWLQLGIEHPAAYLDGWLMTSFGMWYPGAEIDGYEGNEVYTFTYGESSYFGYETELPGIRDSKIPVIDSIYRWLSLDPTIQRIPVISLLFSPGFMLWVMIYLLAYMFYVGRGLETVPYLLPLIVILTCLLGPVSLVRYSYYLWILVPVGIIDVRHRD